MFADLILSHGTVGFVAAYVPHPGYSRDVFADWPTQAAESKKMVFPRCFQQILGRLARTLGKRTGQTIPTCGRGLQHTVHTQDSAALFSRMWLQPLTSPLPTMMTIISATWTPGHSKVLEASADALISSCVAHAKNFPRCNPNVLMDGYVPFKAYQRNSIPNSPKDSKNRI